MLTQFDCMYGLVDLDTSEGLAANVESGEKSQMTFVHEDVRPNVKVSIQEATKQRVDEEVRCGVFVCGPNSLIDAVRTTADSLAEEKNSDTKIEVDVYDEIFEL